jgi:excisionase family DNA binding protein
VIVAEADRARAEPISVKIPEAVRLTGLSRSRIYELMRSGDIEYAKVGSSTLILLDSLRSFIQGRRVGGDEALLSQDH